MNQEDHRLLNSKMNSEIKSQFHHLCLLKRSNMNSKLNRMIDEFISINKPILSNQRHLERLIITGSRNS